MKLEQAKFHFIGIGGIGMSALAELLHTMGAQVSGSDLKMGKQAEHLKNLGVQVFIGHEASHVKDRDVVVYSSAIDNHNPEIQRARELCIPIIPRAEALAEIMRYKRGIAVGGTHGKTTTTSIISSIFMGSNMDPTIAVGGRLKLIESTARLGKGPWMVAEADESDGSFSRLRPEITIITNIDSDHLDHFGSFENLQKAFLDFALNIPFYGKAIVFGDDPSIRELFTGFSKRLVYYGFNENNDYVLSQIDHGFAVHHNGKELGVLNMQVPGRHTALNAVAAVIATHTAGVPWDQCFSGANQYSGVDRRFQFIGEARGVSVYDDYAHHPTEISATLQGARQKFPQQKIYVIHQPHRFTRTRDCWNHYSQAFRDADEIYLLDVYRAGETPIDGIHSKNLAVDIQGDSFYAENPEKLIAELSTKLKEGDVVFTMGAGDVWQYTHKLLETLKS
ncbi:MAG: UDP-N-acetylmuramate--L-alanine ligase [Bdellovibrionales bacterium]|nr:UDP-N-acetylmuramate--L-alanine ligase [Bdellovibrionales bacterium]